MGRLRTWRMLWLGVLLLASSADAQCPDGSPPPCGSPRPVAPQLLPDLRRLTTSGRVGLAQLSSDGRLLAYVESRVLFVSNQVMGGRPIEVSREPWRYSRGIRWFPDNSRLLAWGDSGLFILPSLGGAPRLLGRFRLDNVSLSPDARFALISTVMQAQVLNLETRARRKIAIQPADTFYREHAWSPNGRFFVVVSNDGKRRFQLQTVSVATGAARVLLRDSVPLRSPHWDVSTGSIVYSRVTETATQVWRQQVSATGAASGAPRLVLPLLDSPGFQLAENGHHLAFARNESVQNYFVRGVGEDTTNRRLTEDATLKPFVGSFSPDGRIAAFVRVDASGHNLHVSRTDSIAPEQLTLFRDRSIRHISWSPDGRRIAYCTTSDQGPRVGVVAVEGGQAVNLSTRNLSASCMVGWAADDVVLYSLVGNRNFAAHSLSGAPEARLVNNDSLGWMFNPVTDMNGDRVAIYWNRRGGGGTWLIGLRDSLQRKVTPFPYRALRFSPDGSALYITPGGSMLRVRLGESVTTDTIRTPSTCAVLDVSPDGKRVLCHVAESIRYDVWLIRNFDPDRASARP